MQRRLALFGRKFERFQLIFPIVCLGFVLAELSLFFSVATVGQRILWFVSSSLLIGTVHSVLTFTLMMFLPEVRAWMRAKGGGSLARFLITYGLIMVAMGFAALVLLLRSWGVTLAVLIPLLLMRDFVGQWHCIKQFQGLSLLYNFRARSQNQLS